MRVNTLVPPRAIPYRERARFLPPPEVIFSVSMIYDDTLLREVRDRNNIVEVVSDYVSLRKAGGRLKGLCPFHSERTPSFTVQEREQFFYCFGCQTGGDVISFVREIHGYNFMEAVRHLADRAGIDVPEAKARPASPGPEPQRQGPRRARGREEKGRYYQVGNMALAFYRDAYDAMEGSSCRSYVDGRELTRETIDTFALGFAPDRWDGLARHLEGHREIAMLAEQLGLTALRKSGDGRYDRFRNRLMFPIRNLAGEVIAFGGRALATSTIEDYEERTPAKYINSPDNPVYQKGEMLFGLYEARQALRGAGYGLVVEGNVDVLRVAQGGFPHVVAPMGTALTEAQCRLLHRFVDTIVLLYDGDDAGRAASLKAIPMALAEGLKIQVVSLPDGQDPDTFLSEEGPERLQALVDSAPSGWRHLLDMTLKQAGFETDPAGGTALVVDRLAPILDGIPDRRERGLRTHSLAEALHLRDAQLEDFLQEARRKMRPAFASNAPSAPDMGEEDRPAPPPPEREFQLLRLMLMSPECRAYYRGQDAARWITATQVRDALDELADAMEQNLEVQPGVFVASLRDSTLRNLLAQSLVSDAPAVQNMTDARGLLKQLHIDHLSRRLKARKRELDSATQSGDDVAAMDAVSDMKRYAKEIEALKRDV